MVNKRRLNPWSKWERIFIPLVMVPLGIYLSVIFATNNFGGGVIPKMDLPIYARVIAVVLITFMVGVVLFCAIFMPKKDGK